MSFVSVVIVWLSLLLIASSLLLFGESSELKEQNIRHDVWTVTTFSTNLGNGSLKEPVFENIF